MPSVVAASLEAFFLGDGLDPFGSFAACPSDVIMVPALQCFCADLENSDVGVFVIDGILTNKQGEETRHIYVTRCEPQIKTMVILQVNTAPPVFPLTFCLERVWLEANRKFGPLWVKGCGLMCGSLP